jgi:hypothetical protein
LISVVVHYILSQLVMHDLKLYGFIHVLLVFIRAILTRPKIMKRFAHAFHLKLIAPILNVLVSKLETNSGED